MSHGSQSTDSSLCVSTVLQYGMAPADVKAEEHGTKAQAIAKASKLVDSTVTDCEVGISNLGCNTNLPKEIRTKCKL